MDKKEEEIAKLEADNIKLKEEVKNLKYVWRNNNRCILQHLRSTYAIMNR